MGKPRRSAERNRIASDASVTAHHKTVPNRHLPSSANPITCPQCDLPQHRIALDAGDAAHCARCHAMLYRHHPHGLERSLAFAITALVCFIIGNAFPLIGLEIAGDRVEARLIDTAWAIQRDGMALVAGLLLLATFVIPLLQILAILYVLLPLHLGRRAPLMEHIIPLLGQLRHWSMVEVFVLGVLVALVKLQTMAHVVPGIALWACIGLMLSLTAAVVAFDSGQVVARVAELQSGDRLASPPELPEPHGSGRLGNVWAFVIASAILYIPANLLPIMTTETLFDRQSDTILSGIAYLWHSGSWPLALIVFIASVAVPLLKLLALVLLAVSVQWQMDWDPLQRTRLYRLVELVGKWSMVDIFVVALLVTLVQLKALATITAGPAAFAFAAVVVLTMFAAMSFDPRQIWNHPDDAHA